MKFTLIGPTVSEAKTFEMVYDDRRRQNKQGRPPEQGFTKSSLCEPNGSAELIMNIF